MASNNSLIDQSSESCIIPENLQRLSDQAWLIAYYVITPIHFILGFPSTTLFIFAFYKQIKQEKGYVYQFVSAINKLAYLFSYVAYVTMFNWCSGVGGQGVMWFMQSYFLMWCAAHLVIPVMNIFGLNGILFSLCITFDRVFALSAPLKYKNINHKRYQTVTFSMCIVVSIIVNTPDFMLNMVEKNNLDYYTLSFLDVCGLPCLIIGHIRNILFIASAITQLVCNSIMLYLYRKRGNRVSQMTSNNAKKESIRKQHEKTLFILTIYESILVFFNSTLCAAFYTAMYVSVWFYDCGFIPFQPLMDATMEILDLLEYYIVFTVSKQFRKFILDILPISNYFKTGTVPTATQSVNTVSVRTVDVQ